MADNRTLREVLGNTDLSREEQEKMKGALEKIENPF